MRIDLIVYYDYLCPWCYNAAIRLRRLRDQRADVALHWRSFLLRPQPRPGERSLEKFRLYTETWRRPAAEADGGAFHTWQGSAGPPSHSIPPHAVAKAAARISPDAFDTIHEKLMHAYFAESRDITDRATLEDLWKEAGLPPREFADHTDPSLYDAVVADHREATEIGVSGVPAVRPADREAHVVGAHPIELYEKWVERLLTEKRRERE